MGMIQEIWRYKYTVGVSHIPPPPQELRLFTCLWANAYEFGSFEHGVINIQK